MQPLKWYVNRLSLMSPGEVVWRVQQAVNDRLGQYLPLGQIPAARISAIALPSWPVPALDNKSAYLAAADRVLGGEVDLYGQWVKIANPAAAWNSDPQRGIAAPMDYGKLVDFRDENLVGSARDAWELNRHYQLVTLAQAWALSGDERYREGARELLSSWLKACPYPLGINWSSALEHGIRLINWYLGGRLLGLGRDSEPATVAWLESIFRHCEFIWSNQSRYSSANNHLLGEMVGLYVAGCAWPCWPQSAEWRSSAKRILEREVQAQVHPDGVGREQTVSYQMFILEFLIIAGLVGESSNDPFSSEYWTTVQKMIGFLQSIVDAGGHLPDVGDADDGVVFMLSPDARHHKLQALSELALTFSRRDPNSQPSDPTVKWLTRGFPLPAAWPKETPTRRREFPDGGYYVLGAGFGTPNEATLLFDAAPLGFLSIAAHGHADCLAFTLSLAGEQVLIDPGTYCYHTEPVWRTYFRSTAAHNTLRVDGIDQSEMCGAFMWSQKAVPKVESVDLKGSRQRIRASHNGYKRLADPVIHAREIVFDADATAIEVADTLTCIGTHRVERFFHFAEDCLVQTAESTVTITTHAAALTLRCGQGTQVQVFRGSENPRVGWVSRRFGLMTPTTTVVLTDSIQGATTLNATLNWRLR